MGVVPFQEVEKRSIHPWKWPERVGGCILGQAELPGPCGSGRGQENIPKAGSCCHPSARASREKKDSSSTSNGSDGIAQGRTKEELREALGKAAGMGICQRGLGASLRAGRKQGMIRKLKVAKAMLCSEEAARLGWAARGGGGGPVPGGV